MKIKELGTDERPREKLQAKGASSLSNAELLAILLRTGTENKNAVDLARELLRKGGDTLTGLSKMSMERMRETQGIGRDKAVTVMALFELGRRFTEEKITRRVKISTALQVFKMMQPRLKGLGHEECWAIFLNRANHVIARERMSSGGLTATVMDCNMIIKAALEKQATGLIMVHNHPSGDTHPGLQDKLQTANLKNALEPYRITLLDHIIISDDSYYSFDSGENTILSSLAVLAEK